MSEGLATYLSNPSDEGLVTALDAAKQVLVKRVPPVSEGGEWTFDGLWTLVKRGIVTAAETTLAEMLQTERVVGSEVSIGSGRIDLVTAPLKLSTQSIPGGPGEDNDYFIVTDHKTSIQKAPRFIESDFKDIPLNWQLWDYAWRAQQYYGRPVRWIRIHQIILSPRVKCIMSEPSRIKPENLDHWLANAELHWGDMVEDDKVPFGALRQSYKQCNNKYGQCPAYEACHSFLRDEKVMEALYIRRSR